MDEAIRPTPGEPEPSQLEELPGTSKQSTEDLAGGLFNQNQALASVVRDLQQRNKRAQKNKADAEGCEKVVDDEEAPGVAADRAVEQADAPGLWVVGGASTVMDAKDAKGAAYWADAKDAKDVAATQPEVSTTLGEVTGVPIDKDCSVKPAPAVRPQRNNKMRDCCAGTLETLKEFGDIVRLYPSAVIVPLMLFLVLTGLGIWGVMAGAQSHVQQRKDDARSRAVDAATGFQIQLQQSFTPGVTFSLLVKQRPDWQYWLDNFNATAAELLSRVPAGALWNLQLQPFAQVMSIYPLRPEDLSQIIPARDLLADPTRRDDILRIIRTKEQLVVGPFPLVQGFTGAFVRYPIYVPDVDANETFGFRYRDNATEIPYSGLPASVRSCTVCYNATSREKWWGLMTVLVNYDAVTQGQDAYLSNLRNMGFYYALVRPDNATHETIIAKVGPTDLRDADAVTVEVKVVNRIWLLRVAPEDGFEPSWRGPLIAAVIIIALIMSILLFVSMASFKRQVLLLHETVAANRNLAETTQRLEDEKERMDVLLVRQYDLLRCLDANRTKRSDDDLDTVNGSRRAMMVRIEDARRSLNVAKASVEDPIQVFEILGAGAFGKVQRGTWRGTVVAVKTMILPANMTGQEKREKMAVMEAAISSSLVHPNIVTTYTYFIRPYHEPTHDGVQQMVISPSSQADGSSPSNKATEQPLSMDKSVSSESTIHSYEVRLVLEFCDKGSLKDALDQSAFMEGLLNLAAMLETASDVAKAMVHMHAANVLHSDLKARNIMMKSSGTEGRGVVAKVADFGLSTRMEHQETHLSSCFQGTLTHMAPEVMLEGRISKAADVYSFGILMWELFCGGDPFAGVPRAHIGHAITKEGRRPKFPPFAPRGYVTLASRCWDPDASLRPTFEEVLSELTRMRDELGGETRPLIIAPPRPVVMEQNDGGDGGFHAESRDDRDGSGFGGHESNNGVTTRNNPLALYNAGIVLGGGSTMGSNAGMGGMGSNAGMGGMGSMGSPGVGSHSSLAQRAMMKSSLAQRHLRKLGIRIGGGGSSGGMTQTLSVLDEETEQK